MASMLRRRTDASQQKKLSRWEATIAHNAQIDEPGDMLQPSGVAAPGFASASDLGACRDPAAAFRFLCENGSSTDANQTRQGIRMEKWVQLAPPMGLADFITADATFDQLATADDNAEEERTIKADVLARYCERICSKSAPGAAKVGGVRFGRGGDSAERMIRRHPASLAADEKVLMAGGVPSYLVQDMNTTPRSSGTIILTTHALYWRPHGLRSHSASEDERLRRYALDHTFLDDHESDEWLVEPCRTGPFGLGVTDTGLHVRQSRRADNLLAGTSLHAPPTSAPTDLRFNFPMNTELRDTFVSGVTEVLAAHAFCVKWLGQAAGVLTPAVTEALVGAVVRQRAARSLGDGGKGSQNRCKLPFSVVASEAKDSLLPLHLAKLLALADERERRAAEVVADRYVSGVNGAFDTKPALFIEGSRGSNGDQSSGANGASGANADQTTSAPRVRRKSVVEDDKEAKEMIPEDDSAVDSSAAVAANCLPVGATRSAEEWAAEALAATAAARRQRAKGADRALATFAALPAEEENRLRRIRHNIKLMRVLVTQPVLQVMETGEGLVTWERPVVAGTVLSVLQLLVFKDCLGYVPALLVFAVAASVMEVQRQHKIHGTAYHVDYHYEVTKGLMKKARRLDDVIGRVDVVVYNVLKCLLKIHSAFASVDDHLSLRFALGLIGLGALLTLIGFLFQLVPLWLILSTAISITFSVRHPVVTLVQTSQSGSNTLNASSAAAAALWSAISIFTVLCLAPFDRVVTCASVCAVTFVCWRYALATRTGTNEETLRPACQHEASEDVVDLPFTIHSRTLGSWRVEMQRQAREWWELLPAPIVRNTADSATHTAPTSDMPRT